jgi:hypothetical protein
LRPICNRLGMEICPSRTRNLRRGGENGHGTTAGDLREGLDGAVVDTSQALVAIMPDYGFSLDSAFMQHSLLALAGIQEVRIVDKGITDLALFEVRGHFALDA